MQVNSALNEVCEWFVDNKTVLSVLGLDVKQILSRSSPPSNDNDNEDSLDDKEEDDNEGKKDLQGTFHKIISYKPKLNGPLLLGMLRPKAATVSITMHNKLKERVHHLM